jgi:hypothetical protein
LGSTNCDGGATNFSLGGYVEDALFTRGDPSGCVGFDAVPEDLPGTIGLFLEDGQKLPVGVTRRSPRGSSKERVPYPSIKVEFAGVAETTASAWANGEALVPVDLSARLGNFTTQ